MLEHEDVRRLLAAERVATLAAAWEPVERRPLRLRIGLWLVRPYAAPVTVLGRGLSDPVTAGLRRSAA
jgi:hypothetical protein